MRHALAFLTLTAVLTGCGRDETISGYADRNVAYRLISGTEQPLNATVAFPRKGRVEIAAPCGTYRMRQTAPYPWLALENLSTRETRCDAGPAETAFLTALQSMTVAEVAEGDLLLSNDDGVELFFQDPDA